MKVLGFIGLVLLQLFSLSGQQNVRGRIVEKGTKEGLIGAHVYLLNNWRKGIIAGEDGFFELELSQDDIKDSL
ncbi:MAG: hypothetical protein AAF789_10180, partial [Bacteroidota bacterium]